jgi:hypothetical protein
VKVSFSGLGALRKRLSRVFAIFMSLSFNSGLAIFDLQAGRNWGADARKLCPFSRLTEQFVSGEKTISGIMTGA